MLELFHPFICTVATCFCISAKNNPSVPETLVNFTLNKLYFNLKNTFGALVKRSL